MDTMTSCYSSIQHIDEWAETFQPECEHSCRYRRYGDPDSVWCLQPGPFTMQTDPAQCHYGTYGSNHTAAARVLTPAVTNLQLSWDHYR